MLFNSHYYRQVNIICKFKQKYQCLSLPPPAGVHWSISETPTQHSIFPGLKNSVTHLPMFKVYFTIGVDAVLTGKSSIAFGLILGLSFFNKLDMNPSQVKVSAVSKCTELRIIWEALSSQAWSLTWRHLSYHDADTKAAQILGGQHKYLPVEVYIGWDDAYDTCWWHNQLDLFSLNRLYNYEASVAIFNNHMIYGNEKTLLMRNWHCVGWPGIRF